MKNMNNKIIRNNFSLIIIGAFISFILCVAILQKGNLYIPIHDALDSNITQYKVLHDNRQFFSADGTIVDYMGGIDRDFLPSELKVYSLPYIFLEPLAALVLLYVIRIVISVLGGLYLARCILKERAENYKHIVIICSFIYGILPSSPVWDLCFAIYPFLFAQIYCIYYKRVGLRHTLLLFAVPFFSELAHFGVFICGYLFVLILFDGFIHKKPNKLLIIALSVISAGYIVSEYRMFRLMILKDAVTIRGEFVKDYKTFTECVFQIKDLLLNSQYHCASVHKFVVLPLCTMYFIYLIYSCVKERRIFNWIKNPFFLIMLWILLNAVLSGLAAGYAPFDIIFTKTLPFMKGIHFENVLRINSFLWYLGFAYILVRIYNRNYKRLSYIICLCAAVAVLHEPAMYNTIRINSDKLSLNFKGYEYSGLSYDEFFSKSLFDKVKEDINYNKEWAAAFGMHPAVLSYNQIATLDGYHSWYTLEYKHKFRNIIAPELELSEKEKKYFDEWGGRAYIFSEEVTFQPVKNLGISEADINIDINAFKSMGGKYIFSRVKIGNAGESLLRLKGIYTDKNSLYTIYVYEAG